MKEEIPAERMSDLLYELAELEDELEAAQTIPLVEVEEADIIEEAFFVPDFEVEEAPPDTRRVPSLEAEMILRQEDPFQTAFFTDIEPTSKSDLTLPLKEE